MSRNSFRTLAGRDVPAVTAAEMRAVDRVAVEDVGFELLQMMENAGRILAWHVRDIRNTSDSVVVVAGNGGNGGGGLVCARHLTNRDIPVEILLDRPPRELTDTTAHQYRILDEMGVPSTTNLDRLSDMDDPLVVDALIGYGLQGELRPPARAYIDSMDHRSLSLVSLDVPSGLDATSGESLGTAVTAGRTVTLALPKTGLDAVTGRLFVGDIGIPGTVYERLGIEYDSFFGDRDWVELAL
ncbi:MAG: NAD(P)H-hydrate epimerase [Natronomonas sp.]